MGALGTLLKLRIDHYAAVTLQGFVNVVDTLGGIDVNVADGFCDPTYDEYGFTNGFGDHGRPPPPERPAGARLCPDPQGLGRERLHARRPPAGDPVRDPRPGEVRRVPERSHRAAQGARRHGRDEHPPQARARPRGDGRRRSAGARRIGRSSRIRSSVPGSTPGARSRSRTSARSGSSRRRCSPRPGPLPADRYQVPASSGKTSGSGVSNCGAAGHADARPRPRSPRRSRLPKPSAAATPDADARSRSVDRGERRRSLTDLHRDVGVEADPQPGRSTPRTALASGDEPDPRHVPGVRRRARATMRVERGVRSSRPTTCRAGEIEVRVDWSSVNYKDALATIADGKVARISPLIPGSTWRARSSGPTIRRCRPGTRSWPTATTSASPGMAATAHTRGSRPTTSCRCRRASTVEPRWPSGRPASRPRCPSRRWSDTACAPATVRSSSPARAAGSGSVAVAILAAAATRSGRRPASPTRRSASAALGAAGLVPRDEVTAESPRPLESARWAGRRRHGRAGDAAVRPADPPAGRGRRLVRQRGRREARHDRPAVHPARRRPARDGLGARCRSRTGARSGRGSRRTSGRTASTTRA